MQKLFSFLGLFLFLPSSFFGQGRIFTKQQVQEDLSHLQSALLTYHPNLDIYVTRAEFDRFFAEQGLPAQMEEHEVYSILAASSQVIRDGHTLLFPSLKSLAEKSSLPQFLPFKPYWDGDALYVLENYGSDTRLSPGTEILSINGVESKALVQGMLAKMMRDGNNYQYPTWVLNTYFFEYYQFFHGGSETFVVEVQGEGSRQQFKLKGIPRTLQLEKVNRHHLPGNGIVFDLDQETSTAILTIRDWHRSNLKQSYSQRFLPEMKRIIEEIEAQEVDQLIIDVRNNQGGDTRHAKYLLSYLIAEPFALVEGYQKRKGGQLVKCKGPQMGIHEPLAKTFKGKVLVLINGGSFSNTGIFCSVLRKHHRAEFIGEETGGSEFILAGAVKTITLPNTGITVTVPRLQFKIKEAQGEYHGVLPDHVVKPSLEGLMEGRDEVLEFAKSLLGN